MNLNGVLFLAARTARSQAYAQCMAAHKLIPEKVIIFGKQNSKRLGQSENIICQKMDESLFIPNLSLTLEDSCQDNQWDPMFLDCESINAPALLKIPTPRDPTHYRPRNRIPRAIPSSRLPAGFPSRPR